MTDIGGNQWNALILTMPLLTRMAAHGRRPPQNAIVILDSTAEISHHLLC